MRRMISFLFFLALVGTGVFWWITAPDPLLKISPDLLEKRDIVNGEYMYHAGGCASCHAAPASLEKCSEPGYPNGSDLGGGRCLKTEFGTFYVPNISMHKTAGIGSWSELDFINAMRKGLAPDGSHYYPAFPYTSYALMHEKDLLDLFAYLQTLKLVATASKPHNVGFPFSWRRLLGGWKWLFLNEERFKPDPALSDELNRGKYLVEGPGHCAECHSPRNILGGIDQSRRHAGGPSPEGDGIIPNITPHPKALGKWKLSDIVYALQSGFTPDFDTLGGTMTKVQENMARLSEKDRRAIALYLKSLKPLP